MGKKTKLLADANNANEIQPAYAKARGMLKGDLGITSTDLGAKKALLTKMRRELWTSGAK